MAILLLCGRFGHETKDGLIPLTPAKYNRLAKWLDEQGLRPEFLMEPDINLEGITDAGLDPDHVQLLLDRGLSMGLAMERWANHGIWVLSRADQHYPSRYKMLLKGQAPPVLYGIGDARLLNDGGLAIVGSRDVDEAGGAFAREMAERASRENVTVISGAAKGVDMTAMVTALEAGGAAVGVVSDSLMKHAVYGPYRDAIRDDRMVLISPYTPEASFNAGNAMNRNKMIYTLADWAIVVTSGYNAGGTWAGATENLKKQWVPLFVRSGDAVPEGNLRLVEHGAIPLDCAVIESEASLRDELQRRSAQTIIHGPVDEAEPTTPPLEHNEGADAIFAAIWPIIASHLNEPRTEKELHAALGSSVQIGQLRIWLRRAVEDNVAEKLTRPTRYQLKTVQVSNERQPSLFDLESL